MTARDLFTEDQDPPSGLGIPQSNVTKKPGAVGSVQPQAEGRIPVGDSATAEALTETRQCWSCDRSTPQKNGFIRCALSPVWRMFSPKAPCQIKPVQWIQITPERLAARAEPKNPAKGHGSTTQSVSRNGGGGAEASAAGPAPSPVDSRGTSQIRDTSMRAIWQLRADRKITERQKELLEFFAERPPGVNYTRQEIARQMVNRHGAKWGINAVCGRVHELLKLGRLVELPEYRKCVVTGESVNAIARGVW